MPIYYTGQDETRATTNRVMAALEAFVGWMLYGPRQHADEFRWSLGPVPRFIARETSREGVQR